MKNTENLGWQIINGSGWNRHATASALETTLRESPDDLPTVPNGYAVLVAPISDKPFGLRCELVKVLPRLIVDGDDDGPDESEGEVDQWALDNFKIEAMKICGVREEQQSQDASRYFINKIADQIALLKTNVAEK